MSNSIERDQARHPARHLGMPVSEPCLARDSASRARNLGYAAAVAMTAAPAKERIGRDESMSLSATQSS